MCKEEEKQKSTDIEEYEYGDTDLELEEEDEDEDEYDAMYMELEEEKFDYAAAKEEDFEEVEELKPPCVSSWINPKTGKSRHGIDVVARIDDAQVDFDDVANLCIAAQINSQGKINITKRGQEPDVCSICYGLWTSHGSHRICSLPCGHVFGASCIERWFQTDSCGMCPQCNANCELEDAYPLYATRLCNFAADQKASIRRFPFSRVGYIAFKKYEFARRNHVWNKRSDALKRQADALGRQNDAMKRRSELLDRMANVLKRVKALEHRDNALRRANALRLRADALGRRADEYLRSAETYGLRAKALHQRAIAFGLQVNAFKKRLDFFIDSDKEVNGVA